jgi:branched-chain amino acid transport system ATP-binding protein
MTTLLEIRNVTKRFGGIEAVRDVSFDIPRGSLVGLIGPNGAGKTTLVNLASRHETLSAGEIKLDAQPINGLPLYKVARRGISRTYQHNRLFQEESVIENIRTGMVWAGATERPGLSYPGIHGSQEERCQALLDLFGLAAYSEALPGELSYLLRRRVEVAQALAVAPKLLLLDEPFAGFSHDEADELVDLLRGCQRAGLTILLIDHNMDVMMRACEHLFVMHHGALLASGTPQEIQANKQVISVYLGGEL